MKFIEGMLVGSMVTVGVTMFCTDWISKSDTKKMKKNGVSLNIKIIEGAEKSIPSIFLYTKNCCNVIKNIKKSLHLYLGIV